MELETEETPSIEENARRIVEHFVDEYLGKIEPTSIRYLHKEDVFVVSAVCKEGNNFKSDPNGDHFLQVSNGEVYPAEDMKALYNEYRKIGVYDIHKRPRIIFNRPTIVDIIKSLGKD